MGLMEDMMRAAGRLPGPNRTGASVHVAPCRKITSIRAVEVHFLSDHQVLKNEVANWKNDGTLYTKPDWTPATNHPVSHDMDSVVQLKVVATVDPSNACSESGTWEGSGPQRFKLAIIPSLSLRRTNWTRRSRSFSSR
jgi:hypothetical protein